MTFTPDQQMLELFRSMAIQEFISMDGRLKLKRSKVPASEADKATLANLRAALRFLNSIGAIDQAWLKKYDVE